MQKKKSRKYNPRQKAFDMLLENKSWKEIADKTGIDEAEAKQIKAEAIAKLREQHFGKFLAGMDAKGDMLISNKKVDPAVAEETFKAWLRNLGLRPDAEQGMNKNSLMNDFFATWDR